jgi:ribosomal protein S18 acetylase RimI-like enzyme
VSRIRQFRWDDYEAVVEVWRAAGIDVVGRAELEAKLTRDPELFLVAAPLPLRAGATSESHGPLARKETPAEPIPAGPTAAAEVVVPAGVLGIGGVVMGTYDGRRGWIFRLAVHPAYRRHGLATELVGVAGQRGGAALLAEARLPAVSRRPVHQAVGRQPALLGRSIRSV